jgi:hypothetical protein
MYTRGVDDTMTSNDDPLVAEIRNVRREIASRFGSDINALCDFLAERETQHKDRLVNYERRPADVLNRPREK